MKKLLIYIVFLFAVVCFGYAFFKDELLENEKSKTSANEVENSESLDEIDEEEIQKNIEVLTKRIELKDMISIWDQYFNNEELLLALMQYKKVLKENPNDSKIIYKIWELLFIMKNFSEASDYYKQILHYSNFDQKKYILSLIYWADLTKSSDRQKIKDEIYKNIMDWETRFFYANSIDCIENFHDCKVKFKDKFNELKNNPSSNELKEILTSETNYKNFWLEDISYKNTLYIWSFYKLKLYPVVIYLWEEILKEKPNYKAVQKLVAQSYYEMWNYKKTQDYLRWYFELESTDKNAAYLLWITNLKLNEHYFSIFYLNKALSLWYEDELSIKRKLIYNYYMRNNYDKIYELFYEIDDMNWITADDYNIVVNFSLNNWYINKALEIARKWATKFSNQVIFYEYLAKVYYDNSEKKKKKNYVDKWLQIDKCNELFNYLDWLISVNKRDYKTAEKKFKTAKNCYPEWKYTKEIDLQLKMIKNRLEEESYRNSSDWLRSLD